MKKSAISEFEIGHWRKENETTKLMLRSFYQTNNKSIPKRGLSFKSEFQ